MTDRQIKEHDWCEGNAKTGVGEVDFFICVCCGLVFPGPIDHPCPPEDYQGGCQ